MASEHGSTYGLFDSRKTGLEYFRTYPGILRSANVVLGFLSLILVLLGFPNDYSPQDLENDYERRKVPWYRITGDSSADTSPDYYGAGYVTEHPSIVQLVCIVATFAFSIVFLLGLATSSLCQTQGKSRGWNRFLNLTAGFLQAVGLLSGTFGLLLFRSYCCHVEFISSDRHKSEMEGYREDCSCYFTPTWSDNTVGDREYLTLHYRDVPDDISYHYVLPHHFYPHAICLFLMAINVVMYILASIFI
ncbi:unnamed protein product [Orchesella dallaii]|uniref:Uncharacterized protein n=1 Tax=Orchesella dallaii TaxID=48710 RepID=A0ABP1PP63_9HEXA